ncbi:E3 ubiquitin-protein ligase DCST1-like isoform X2 [Tachypleus tridentatus]|uniref:E3 ubiquitin-protein ligase DCST1-like isoform X2 n=1 Tax=Tachypleus tridentatus TaxID=6853 RepID=UPI003FCEED9D
MGVIACRKGFKEAEERCFRKLSFIGYLLCWPMKLTFICRLVNVFLGDRMCEGRSPVNVGFGESYATGEKISSEMKMDFSLNVQYKLVIPGQQVDQLTPQDVTRTIKNEFDVHKRYFDYIFKIICRILGFMFILVFVQAKNYNNSYLREIQFDNFYITAYFRHIDARRKRKGKRTLLPLKRAEKNELLDVLDLRMSADERSKIVKGSIRLIFQILVVSIILFVDNLLVDVLLILQRYSWIDYHQLGTHDINVIIYGHGAVANLVRAILKGFNQTHTLDQISTSAVCLPSPRLSDVKENTLIYIIYALIWILFFIEAYGIRMRSRICGFFYPKRSKKRILFLYNEWLKRRHSYLHYMKQKIRKAARRNRLTSFKPTFLDKLQRKKPFLAKLFTLFVPSGRKCLLCEEPEKADFHFCENKKCDFCYCRQCWDEIKCYACNTKDYDNGSDLTDDVDDW